MLIVRQILVRSVVGAECVIRVSCFFEDLALRNVRHPDFLTRILLQPVQHDILVDGNEGHGHVNVFRQIVTGQISVDGVRHRLYLHVVERGDSG